MSDDPKDQNSKFHWDENDVEFNPDDSDIEDRGPGEPLLPEDERDEAIKDLDKLT
jgi:hypothetical protein